MYTVKWKISGHKKQFIPVIVDEVKEEHTGSLYEAFQKFKKDHPDFMITEWQALKLIPIDSNKV